MVGLPTMVELAGEADWVCAARRTTASGAGPYGAFNGNYTLPIVDQLGTGYGHYKCSVSAGSETSS